MKNSKINEKKVKIIVKVIKLSLKITIELYAL